MRDFLQRARRRYPNDVWLNHVLADSYWLLTPKDFTEAAGYFRILVGLRPGSLSIRWRLAAVLTEGGKRDEALAEIKEALRLKPDAPFGYNSLAWLLATCPDAQVRDAPLAVTLAKQAVALAPTNASYWNTLGMAHYRADDWKAAVEALSKSEELSTGQYVAVNGSFLAMAHWQLGEKDKARNWYTRAAWMEKHRPQDEPVMRFRAEAAELLGLPKPQPAKQKPATKP